MKSTIHLSSHGFVLTLLPLSSDSQGTNFNFFIPLLITFSASTTISATQKFYALTRGFSQISSQGKKQENGEEGFYKNQGLKKM